MTSQIDDTVPVTGTPTTQSVRDNFTTAANEITALQTATEGHPFLSLQGGRMAAPMYLFNDPTDAMMPATKGYVDAGGGGGGGGIPEAPSVAGSIFGRSQGAWVLVAGLNGATMTGPLVLAADPTAALGAATKQYVDAATASRIPDAPSDGFFYARQNAAWAKALGLTGGQLSGSLGVGVTLPASLAANYVVMGAATSQSGHGINAYQDGSAAWRYLTAGVGASVRLSSNGLSLFAAASGAAGAALTFGPPVNIDYKGNLQVGGALAIPSDAVNPTVSAFEYTAPLAGHYAFNAYLATGPVWKYLANGYAAMFYQQSNGNVQLQTANSGSANGACSLNPAFVFDTGGSLTAPGNVVANAGFVVGGTGLSMYVSAGHPTLAFAASNFIQLVSGSYTLYGGQWPHVFNNTVQPVTDNAWWCGLPPANGGQAWFGVAAYTFATISDPRLKEDITPAPAGALDVVRAVAVKNFYFKNDPPEWRRRRIGFDASEVRKVFADAVIPGDDGESLSLSDMLALLWQAVQELAAQQGRRTR